MAESMVGVTTGAVPQRERERFFRILNGAPAMIAVLSGPALVFEFVNDRFREAARSDALVGRPVRDALPAAAPEFIDLLDIVYRTGERREGHEVPLPVDLDGDGVPDGTGYFDFIYEPLRDADGSVEGVIVHAVDVTAQIDARVRERDRARLSALAADVGHALTTSDEKVAMLTRCAEAVVKHLDAAVARIWTLNAETSMLELRASAGAYADVEGGQVRVPLGHFKVGRIGAARRPHLTNDLATDTEIADAAWARREGLVSFAGFPLLIGSELVGVLAMFAKHPLSDVDFEGLASVAHGISVGISRMRALRALKESEARYRQRAEQLARTAAALERSNRELDAFAYAASHDLRAPLRGIANLAQWIEEDLQSQLPEEGRDMLALMRSRMHRMEALIDGILQYSRAGRTHEAVREIDVGALVYDVVDLLSPETAIVTVAPGLPIVEAERLPLQQVFQNLIGNAVKHGGEGVRIEISARDAGEFWEFRVADDGPGIPAEFHQRIWGIFQTLQPRDQVEGAGIGLSLVKKLVEAQGGRVAVESEPGRGATFSFLWRKAAFEGRSA